MCVCVGGTLLGVCVEERVREVGEERTPVSHNGREDWAESAEDLACFLMVVMSG